MQAKVEKVMTTAQDVKQGDTLVTIWGDEHEVTGVSADATGRTCITLAGHSPCIYFKSEIVTVIRVIESPAFEFTTIGGLPVKRISVENFHSLATLAPAKSGTVQHNGDGAPCVIERYYGGGFNVFEVVDNEKFQKAYYQSV